MPRPPTSIVSPSSTAWRKAAPPPGVGLKSFRLAPGRTHVADWGVSSEPALRHLRASEEGSEEQSARALRKLFDRAGPASPASKTIADHSEPIALRFDEVFRRYAPYVGAIVLRLIGRPGDVDDVVQDVFMQAHRGLSKLRDPDAVRPWLRRIAVRRSRRWLRTRWVRRWLGETELDAETDLVDASASPEERAQIAHVYRKLERMPKNERIVWVLRLVDGETLESIADLLGCSVSTVQRRLRAASAVMGEMQ